ncbi:MAG: hypothetical protein ACK53A_03800 [Gemmatimonadota bacterium]|jgi:hypothetical protein|nr:hypothetical protein [Gemmatimonadota bacterium]
MSSNRVAEVLYDSEAVLRLVDAEVARLQAQDGLDDDARPGRVGGARREGPDGTPAMLPLPAVLSGAGAELRALLASLRESRSTLESATASHHAAGHPAPGHPAPGRPAAPPLHEVAMTLAQIERRLSDVALVIDPSGLRAVPAQQASDAPPVGTGFERSDAPG